MEKYSICRKKINECQSGQLLLSLGNLPNPGTEPRFKQILHQLSHKRSPYTFRPHHIRSSSIVLYFSELSHSILTESSIIILPIHFYKSEVGRSTLTPFFLTLTCSIPQNSIIFPGNYSSSYHVMICQIDNCNSFLSDLSFSANSSNPFSVLQSDCFERQV